MRRALSRFAGDSQGNLQGAEVGPRALKTYVKR